ncbi:MAG TPA: UDP-N-acetylglucosamine 1-carboxyvinyltransferase [Candidatus Magasanikbacteria bacterium]|nr:UDP-N-acetylglucosamine 1-carboxyvinyltransferase [Candidatus Magasanikbacteria bacterium]
MSQLIICGGKQLKGEIAVYGAKNHALKMLAASLLTQEPVELFNMPFVEDVVRMMEIMKDLGVSVQENDGTVKIQAQNLYTHELHKTLTPKVRASVLFVGPLLLRRGKAVLPYPGGCSLGRRPIDLLLKAFKALGADVHEREDEVKFSARKLKPATFVFPFVSHTTTEALMMTMALISGTSHIVNAAMEPEVVALAEFLNACGAKIKGAGSPEIVIEGVAQLRGGQAHIIPDRLEAGAFMAMAAATHSTIKITHCNPAHLAVPLYMMRSMQIDVETGPDWIEVKRAKEFRGVNITTHEYPGFPTDLQPPFTVALTQAKGMSMVHETIFEGRLFYVDKLNRMGANILLCDPHRVLVAGPKHLRGTRIESPDIRAGMAMVIAGLAAHGTTTIENIYQIYRGYYKIDERLAKLGADIKKIG